MSITLVSWNVNGLRSALKKGFEDAFQTLDADYFCLQETKMQPGQAEINAPSYHVFWNSAVKKGYAGTAIFAKREPINVTNGIGIAEFDHEGRVITLEAEPFYLVTCYTPNAQDELRRLAYRLEWEEAFRAYLHTLDAKKPVILCGDLNVCHKEIDIKNARANVRHAGFTAEEREKMTLLLDSGFVDTYRHLYPDKTGAYTWWSYFGNARERNTGWRLDYFIVSERLREMIVSADIHADVYGSDHCPVGVTLAL